MYLAFAHRVKLVKWFDCFLSIVNAGWQRMRSNLDIPPLQRRTIGMEKVEESVEMNPAVGVGG